MTRVEQLIENSDVTLYKILQEMGHNPSERQGNWSKKIKGKRSLTKEQAKNLEKTLDKMLDEDIDEPLFKAVKYKCI